MCLDKIDKVNPFGPKDEVKAWGVFTTQELVDKLFPWVMLGCSHGRPYPVNVWIKKDPYTKRRLTDDTAAFYPVGFHKFATRKGAEALCNNDSSESWNVLRKVLLRKVRTVGWEELGWEERRGRLYKVYVADEMKILPE